MTPGHNLNAEHQHIVQGRIQRPAGSQEVMMETSGIVTFIMAEFRNCDNGKIVSRLIIRMSSLGNYEQLVYPRKKTLQNSEIDTGLCPRQRWTWIKMMDSMCIVVC